MSPKQIFIVSAVVVVIVSGFLLWWQWPSRVVQSAFQDVEQSKIQDFKATIDIENNKTTTQVLGEQGKVHVELTGVFERRDKEQSALQSVVNISIQSESVTVQLSGETRFVDDKAYLLISKSPAAFPALAQLKGKWIEIPRGGKSATVAGVKSTDKQFSYISRSSWQKHKKGYVLKYNVLATQSATVGMMNAIAELLGTELTEQQLNELRQGMAQVNELPVELWITPLSHQLRHVQTVLSVLGGNTMKFTLQLNDHPENVTITKPDKAVTAGQALTPTKTP